MQRHFSDFLKLQILAKILWLAWLWFGPVTVFAMARFGWEINAINQNIGAYLIYPTAVSGLCALITALVYLVMVPRKMVLPALIFSFDCAVLFSHFGDLLESKDFADFIKPESAYIEKHCAPMKFIQDRKTYLIGICDLDLAADGSADFTFFYDTSEDIYNYDHLNSVDRLVFDKAVRKYFNDDPNEPFEYSDFTSQRYYKNFFSVVFDGAETEGFTGAYGPPPKNAKNSYVPFFREP